MRKLCKKWLSVFLVFAMTIGLVGSSFSFAADSESYYSGASASFDSPMVNISETDYMKSSVYDPAFEYQDGYVAQVYSDYYGDYINHYCVQESTDGSYVYENITSVLEFVNTNTSDSQVKSYFNDQVSKGNLDKLTIAVWDNDDSTSWAYDNPVPITTTGEISDKYWPDAHTSDLIQALDGFVNFVPDGEYAWDDLCQMCDIIVCPYSCTASQMVMAEYYCKEVIEFMGRDPRGYIYYDFESSDFSVTSAEAFALFYGDPVYKYYNGYGYNALSSRSNLCQLYKMDIDGTVVLSADVCHHDYEAQSFSINDSSSDENNGVISIKCKHCGDTIEIYGCGKTMTRSNPPTCTSSGSYTYNIDGTYSWSTISGESESQSFSGSTTTYAPATGHTIVTDSAVEATCTTAGLTEGSHCSTCGEVFTAQEEIPAKGHTVVTIPAQAPTCDENGLTEGQYCSVCGTVLEEQQSITATGHNYTDPNFEWQNSGAVVVSNVDSVRNDLVSLAEKQIGVPYVFSGKSPSEGFDCSGLTYYLYKTITGIELPWNVDDLNKDTGIRYGQNLCGDEITRGSNYNEFVSKLKVGDLVFMNEDPDDGTPTHVGIFVGTDNNGTSWIIDACYDNGMVIQEDMYNRWEKNAEDGKIITGARRIIVGTSDFTTGAVMTLSCKDCDSVTSVDCEVELTDIDEPTCTGKGIGYYTATGEFNGEKYTDTFKETINPKGHSYSVISCSLAENDDSEIMQLGAKTYALVQDSTITIGCNDCDDVEIIDNCETELTSEQNATCGENGFITYTITGEYNGRTYTAQFTSELLATDEHNWDVDNVDIIDVDILGGTVTVEFHCLDCDATTQVTAPLEFEVYSDASGEYTSVTMYATLIVGDKEYHFEQTVSAQAQQEMDTHDWVLISETEATCKDNGEKYYECSKDGCDATKTIITPASNHKWDIEWDWAGNYSSCTANATCSVCGTTETKTCTVVGPVKVGDRTAYTATAVFSDGQQFSSAKYTDASEVGAQDDDDPDDSNDDSSGTSGITTKAASPEASSGEATESASSESTGTGTNAVVTTDSGTDTASGGTVSSTSGFSTGTDTNTPTGSTAEETVTPKTGDNIIWLCALGLSAVAVAGITVGTKKKEKNN